MDYMRSLERALRPEIAVPLVYLLFISFAFLSYIIPDTSRYLLAPDGAFSKPGLMTYAVAILSIAVFSASAILGSRVSIREEIILILVFIAAFLALYLTFEVPLVAVLAASGGFTILLFFISKKIDDQTITWVAFSIATLASLSLLYKGIPILETVSREATAIDPSRAIFHGFAVLSASFLIAFYKKRTAFAGILFLLTLAILSGFKSDAIAVIVSASITGLLLRKTTLKEIGAGIIAVVLILALAGTYIAEVAYGSWSVPEAYYIFYRAGLTFAVFDRIVGMGFPFGYLHGEALLDATQMIVSIKVLPELYTEPHIITSTLIGPGMLDFGVPGALATALFVGVCLGVMNRMRDSTIVTCLYAIALTHTFILVEVGLQLTSILFYLALLYLGTSYNKPKG
jgi:hypothetical protein